MKVYTPGQNIAVTLPFKNEQGTVVVPTALSYRIVNELGTEVVANTPILTFDASKGEYTVTVLLANNALPVGAVSAYRRVEMTVVTAGNSFVVSDDYIIEATNLLVVGTNSTLTYEEALLYARQLGVLKGWSSSTSEQQKIALLQAYNQLCGFVYQWEYEDDYDATVVIDYAISQGNLRDLTLAEFQSLEVDQQNDFKRAQLVQADYNLGGSPTEKMIQDGLQSSTIGEVSQFFRPRPTLNLPVCREALHYVGKYIVWSPRVTRT